MEWRRTYGEYVKLCKMVFLECHIYHHHSVSCKWGYKFNLVEFGSICFSSFLLWIEEWICMRCNAENNPSNVVLKKPCQEQEILSASGEREFYNPAIAALESTHKKSKWQHVLHRNKPPPRLKWDYKTTHIYDWLNLNFKMIEKGCLGVKLNSST